MKELVAINGEIFNPSEAKISVFDRGFLYGDGIYEVVRSYGRSLFGLEPHTNRLFNSADRLGINIGFSKREMMDEITRIYNAADRDDAYVRIVITRGEGPITLDPNAAPKPNIVILVKDIPPMDPKMYQEGIDLRIPSILRNSKKTVDPNVKSGNYLNNIMALAEAKQNGAHDAVMLNKDGHVTEGTTSNIYMVLNGGVVTPPDRADILLGITRMYLKELCQENNIAWEERFFTADEMKAADEVFATGSVKEVIPVRSIDGEKIGDGGPGLVTKNLMALYKGLVKKHCQ